MKRTILWIILSLAIATVAWAANYAILIGVNNYEHLSPLRHAEKDALDMEQILRQAGFRTVLLTGRDAHRQAIQSHIRRFAEGSTTNDALLLFFSGHGIGGVEGLQKGIFTYWDNPAFGEVYAQQELIADMQAFRGNRYLILDACFQGEQYAQKDLQRIRIDTRSIEEAIRTYQLDLFIAASASDETASDGVRLDGRRIENGVATHIILEGIRTGHADMNDDGIITIGELVEYVQWRSSRLEGTIHQRPEGRVSVARLPLMAAISATAATADSPTERTYRITTTPTGATISVNGTRRGTTPLTISLTHGTYRIGATMDGYQSQERTISFDTKDLVRDETVHFTLQRTNRPPTVSQSSPSYNAKDQELSVTLRWTGSDPDGDSLSYEVFLGTTSTNMTRRTTTSSTSWTASNLSEGTTYFWRVVAKDGKGGETTSATRQFDTRRAPVTTTQDSMRTQQNAELIRVKAGSFDMGNTRNDSEGDSDEKPAHRVTLTYDYWIGKYEVTFAEYDAFCDATGRSKPSDRRAEWDTKDEKWVWGAHMGRGTRPVINVSWNDAIAYCNWLSQREGLKPAYDNNGNLLDRNGRTTTDITQVEGYRLPTEAEWEYAARGGHKSAADNKYAGSNNIDEVAWYDQNSGTRGYTGSWKSEFVKELDLKSHPVGQKKPNELGLYDMSGNVWEWCHDWYGSYTSANKTNPIGPSAGSYRVLRGGSWSSRAQSCRVANRDYLFPGFTYDVLGFRLSRTLF